MTHISMPGRPQKRWLLGTLPPEFTTRLAARVFTTELSGATR